MFAAALAEAPARRFFAAHAQSCLGSGLAYVALPLLAYERFDTPWAIAAVLIPDLAPAIVLGPVLGALVDRVGWRACAVAADVLRCLAFVLIMVADSLELMIAGAFVAGLGGALFGPAALSGLPRLVRGERGRGAVLGLYGAIDDLGLTAGPALAALGLAFVSSSALMGVNALSFGVSAALVATVAVRGERVPAARTSLLADARAGVRALARLPRVRTLLLSSTGVVLCVGVTNVGEVVLAREVLGVGGPGLALMVAAGGLGTVLGSLGTRFTAGGPWRWRRAYGVGLAACLVELLVCAFCGSLWIILPALALGGLGNGLALVHDRMLLSASTPEALHGRLFGLQRTCVSLAFAVSYIASGALIAGAGVQGAFLVMAVGLTVVMFVALPRLRAAWPAPAARPPHALGDALA
jgi:MFS family permease